MSGSVNVPQRPGVTAPELKKIMEESSALVILVGDIHLSDRPPASCTESYADDLLDMLSYVAKLEEAVSADAVAWAGDIFHHKQPSRTSHATVLKLAKVAQEYQRPPLVVTGNHDLTSDRLDSLDKQPLGVLYEAGVLQELDGWHPTLPIFGVPWQQRWLAPGTPWEALAGFRGLEGAPEGVKASESLVVTHAPIYPPTVADNVLFELLPLSGDQGLSKAMGNAGYLYYGHIHEPHYHFEVEGVTYANMGSLSRGSLHEYNLARRIQVAIWTPEHGFLPVDIPHKPASEVFKLEQAREKKAEKVSLETFLSEVGSANLDISSTGTIIEHVRQMDIEEPVKAKSIELLEEVKD